MAPIVAAARQDTDALLQAGVDGIIYSQRGRPAVPGRRRRRAGDGDGGGRGRAASRCSRCRSASTCTGTRSQRWPSARPSARAFVREVFIGVYESDMGQLRPDPGAAFAYRHSIGADDIAIFTNLTPEFASPLGTRTVADRAQGAHFFGCSAALISGPRAGEPFRFADLEETKAAVPEMPVIANTGVRHDTDRAHPRGRRRRHRRHRHEDRRQDREPHRPGAREADGQARPARPRALPGAQRGATAGGGARPVSVAVAIDGRVATCTLDRPERLNAIDLETYDGIVAFAAPAGGRRRPVGRHRHGRRRPRLLGRRRPEEAARADGGARTGSRAAVRDRVRRGGALEAAHRRGQRPRLRRRLRAGAVVRPARARHRRAAGAARAEARPDPRLGRHAAAAAARAPRHRARAAADRAATSAPTRRWRWASRTGLPTTPSRAPASWRTRSAPTRPTAVRHIRAAVAARQRAARWPTGSRSRPR